MISSYEDPAIGQQMQKVNRDSRLMRRAWTAMRRKGDYAGMLKIAQASDAMGVPVGVAATSEGMEGEARSRYASGLRLAGARPRPGGLAGYDRRHSSMGGPGVGGYDFRQSQDRMAPTENNGESGGYLEGGGSQGPPTPAGYRAPLLLPPPKLAEQTAADASPSDRFRELWQNAATQEQKDEIVNSAHQAGVPLSGAGLQALGRRRKSLMRILNPGYAMEGQGAAAQSNSPSVPPVSANDPAVAAYGVGQSDPAIATYGQGDRRLTLARNIGTNIASAKESDAAWKQRSAELAAKSAELIAARDAHPSVEIDMDAVNKQYAKRLAETQAIRDRTKELQQQHQGTLRAGKLLPRDSFLGIPGKFFGPTKGQRAQAIAQYPEDEQKAIEEAYNRMMAMPEGDGLIKTTLKNKLAKLGRR